MTEVCVEAKNQERLLSFRAVLMKKAIDPLKEGIQPWLGGHQPPPVLDTCMRSSTTPQRQLIDHTLITYNRHQELSKLSTILYSRLLVSPEPPSKKPGHRPSQPHFQHRRANAQPANAKHHVPPLKAHLQALLQVLNKRTAARRSVPRRLKLRPARRYRKGS